MTHELGPKCPKLMQYKKLKSLAALWFVTSFSRSVWLYAADVQLPPTQDAMAREFEPTRNFGAAGAIAVAGPSAVNAAGQPQGQYQSILQFDGSEATAGFDAQFGAGNWQLTAAALRLYQVAAPLNPIFNVGPGSIELRWIADDNWLEGMGTPAPPPIDAGGNEISWNFLQALLAGSASSLLSTPQMVIQEGTVSIPLALTPSFVNDVLSGGFVSIFARPVSPTVGLTFRSLDYAPDPNTGPRLVLTAVSLVDSDGDLNCDGVVDVSDVNPFILALLDPEAYGNQFPNCAVDRADMNDDGLIDGRDIQGFVGALIP